MSEIEKDLEQLKKSVLVFDLETSSVNPEGEVINIKTNFEDYVKYAKCKWFGAYSYKNDEIYLLNAKKDKDKILRLLCSHDILVGFNSEDFDYPILLNNKLTPINKKFLQVDCMIILGSSVYRTKSGYPYKNRGKLMKYKFKRNSLKAIAEVMKLPSQKGDIDYNIFLKDEWTQDEIDEIEIYLTDDVLVTKQMFDKLWDFWKPFTTFLSDEDVKNLSWIRSTIASLTYKSACNAINVHPTYSDKKGEEEKMGGNVIEPKNEESEDVWYVDYASLYPHIFSMFNLFAEVPENEHDKNVWHGNDLFKVKGYYDIRKKHPLSRDVEMKLKQKSDLKKNDPSNPLVEALKILLNSLYGAVRSLKFEKIHTKNAGWDCCWIGQQIQYYTKKRMEDFGFETVYGDTDSCFCVTTDKSKNDIDYVKQCLKTIVDEIKSKAPFPVKTFSIDVEKKLAYILFPFSERPIVDEKTRKLLKNNMVDGYIEDEQDGKKVIIETKTNTTVKIGRKWVTKRMGAKKNYLYIYEDKGEKKVKLVGLPMTKDNATALSMKIFNEVLEEQILKKNNAKFKKEYINSVIKDYLNKEGVLKSLSIEYKVKPFDSYKKENQIQAQISKEYFNGGDGVINLIKNKKIGKIGKGVKYCSVEEAVSADLSIEDLDLEKLYNELEVFILYEEPINSDELKAKSPVKTPKKKSKEQIKKRRETLDELAKQAQELDMGYSDKETTFAKGMKNPEIKKSYDKEKAKEELLKELTKRGLV